jgi:uncharacterized protein YggE
LTAPLFHPASSRRPLLAVVLALLLAPAASAQQGITVTAVGEAHAVPDVLVIAGTLSESAESAEDSVVAFRDSRRRAIKAIELLGLPGLRLSPGALRVTRGGLAGGGMGIAVAGVGGGEEVMPGSTVISQSVVIEVPGIDAMEQEAVIDLILAITSAAGDAGIAIGEVSQEDMMMAQFGQGMPASDLAGFKVSDPQAAAQQSAEDAMAQARAKAQRLADLAGVRLGRVTAIVETPVAAEVDTGNSYMQLIWGLAGEDNADPDTHPALEPVPVRTQLTVTYAIED